MTQHQIDAPEASSAELQQALDRAEQAEARLAELQAANTNDSKQEAEPTPDGVEALRADSMMAHLLDSLDAGKDIGHYGRLVFAMVARHFLSDQEVLAYLTKDPDFSAEQARLMLRQVEGRDYNPPKRDRILGWQAQQDFPILPNPEDPDCGNLYRSLTFPEKVYEHIGHYQEQKLESGS